MSKETRLGMYIVGGIVLLLGFLAYGAFALFTQGVPALTRMATDEVFDGNGTANANLYVEGPFVSDYAASAVLELPPVSEERDSPSVQIGFMHAFGNVQGGLIRTPKGRFRLQAFVAYAIPGNGERVQYFNTRDDGPHAVELRVRDGTIAFFVDGVRRFTIVHSRLLPPNGNPWLFLGTAATFSGNSAYGTISDIRIRRDGDAALHPYRPICNISNGGIHIMPYGDGWILRGTSMRSVPIDYEGCRDVFARHRALAHRAG